MNRKQASFYINLDLSAGDKIIMWQETCDEDFKVFTKIMWLLQL
jgi:hypothetical protein